MLTVARWQYCRCWSARPLRLLVGQAANEPAASWCCIPWLWASWRPSTGRRRRCWCRWRGGARSFDGCWISVHFSHVWRLSVRSTQSAVCSSSTAVRCRSAAVCPDAAVRPPARLRCQHGRCSRPPKLSGALGRRQHSASRGELHVRFANTNKVTDVLPRYHSPSSILRTSATKASRLHLSSHQRQLKHLECVDRLMDHGDLHRVYADSSAPWPPRHRCRQDRSTGGMLLTWFDDSMPVDVLYTAARMPCTISDAVAYRPSEAGVRTCQYVAQKL